MKNRVNNNFDNIVTPLELLNIYNSDGKSTGPKESKLYQKFNRELTWDAILNEGYQEDLAPMLYYIINKSPVFKTLNIEHRTLNLFVSDEIKDKLKSLCNQYLVQNMIQFKELDTILNAFEKEGIDLIQLKGAWIAKNYYPDPALRPMGDLDLLVRKEDMKRAKECLMNIGYALAEGPDEETFEKRHFHFSYVKHNVIFSTVVELHHNISRAKYDFIDYDIREFWENALPISEAYKHVFTIPKEYLLLHLFWHTYLNLSNHLYIRLIWLLDIVSIIREHRADIDWVFIEKKANKWGIRKRVYFCLILITQLLHMDFDRSIMEKMRPSQNSLKLFNLIMLRKEENIDAMDPNRFLIIVFNLIALNTISEKIQYFLRYESKKVLTKKERIKRKYNLSSKISIYLFYLIHPIILILKLFKNAYRIFLQKQSDG